VHFLRSAFRILFFILSVGGVVCGLSVACTKKPQAPVSPEEALIERGRLIYSMQCTACHSGNPKVDGSIGPAIAGSSLELVEARVMRAEYPAGYQPKRTTKTMSALPHLKAEIPALQAYLNSQEVLSK
jgi:mono/diheme cytochrome c family protein